MRFLFACLPLRVKFSWGIWAIYGEIFLIQKCIMTWVLLLTDAQCPSKKTSYKEELEPLNEKQIRSIQHIPGVYKDTDEKQKWTQPQIWYLTLSCPGIAMSQARREPPLPVPAVAQEGLGFPNGNRPKPTHCSQHIWTPLRNCLRCICKAPKLNLQKLIKQRQVVKLQRNSPLCHST